ncbi:hypothetical protein BN3658_00682 [Coriobacteriaceae bacterium CHKCI002]|nr:hypothetical protein BN3658_00682 [Coriobacteriaceae bacterium CHKCI002]
MNSQSAKQPEHRNGDDGEREEQKQDEPPSVDLAVPIPPSIGDEGIGQRIDKNVQHARAPYLSLAKKNSAIVPGPEWAPMTGST